MTFNTFSAGTKAKASEVNQNFAAVSLRTKIHTYTGPGSHTGDTNWSDVTSFTITHDADSMLVGIHLEFTSNQSGASGANAAVRLELTGSTLTTHYLGTRKAYGSTTAADASWNAILSSSTIEFTIPSNGSLTMGGGVIGGILLPDTSTTFTLQQKVYDSADTTEVSNVTIRVIYANYGNED